MIRPSIRTILCCALVVALAGSVTSGARPDSVREYRRANEHAILTELTALLSIPNEASDRENIRRNAAHLMGMMERRGLKPRLLESSDPAAPPAVYGEWLVPGATRSLVFYAHYDGQPADPEQWTAGRPWEPTLHAGRLDTKPAVVPMPAKGQPIDPEWRIYGRSASDDKAGVMAILTAIDALRATGTSPQANIKLFFEGEEEAGSPHLREILTKNAPLLAADLWIICDGPVHQSGRKQVVFGVRGDTNVTVTVYGPLRPLHSGHYGNWAPNPGMLLAQLLASMKDASGRVTIDGWYDDVEPLGELERQALADAPRSDDDLKRDLAIGQPEGGGADLLALLQQPSLNVNGIRSADVGNRARNVIPTTATATLDLRLVKGNDRDRQVGRLISHIEKQGYYVVSREPTVEERREHPLVAMVVQASGGYNASRTRMDLPVSRAVVEAVQSVSDRPVVLMPSLGGSLPLVIFNEVLGVETITVPIANFDNNQHAEDENLRLQNLWDGIEIMAAIMAMRY